MRRRMVSDNKIVSSEVTKIVRDLVCEMEINEKAAGYSTMYEGEMFHFCSAGCQAEFLRRREAFLVESRLCCDPAAEEKKHDV